MVSRERVARGLTEPERADVVGLRDEMFSRWPFKGSSPVPPGLQRLRCLVYAARHMSKATSNELQVAFIQRALGSSPETDAALEECSKWWRNHRRLRRSQPRRDDEEDLVQRQRFERDAGSVLCLLRFFDSVPACRAYVHRNARPRELNRFLRTSVSHGFSHMTAEDYIEWASRDLLTYSGPFGFRSGEEPTSSDNVTVQDAAALKLTLAVLRWLYTPRGAAAMCPMARLPGRVVREAVAVRRAAAASSPSRARGGAARPP